MGTWSLWFFWLAIPNRQGSKCTSKNDSNPNNKFEKKTMASGSLLSAWRDFIRTL